jgi:signal transduction histidine kinase
MENSMANCPKCGYKLKLRDIKPECPECGVNVVYYKIEDRLREDADKAELEQAKFQPKMDRLKASVFGSPLAIIRLVLMILLIVSLLLPLAKIRTDLPFGTSDITVNLVAIYKFFGNLDFELLFKLFNSKVLGNDFVFFAVAFFSLLLTVVVMILNLAFMVMSFGKKGIVRNVSLNAIGIVLISVSAICFHFCSKGFEAHIPGLYAGSVSWGIVIVILLFVALIVVNLLFKILKIEVKYTYVDDLFLPYEQRKAYREEQERLKNESDEVKAAKALKEAEERLKAAHEQVNREKKKKK